MNKIEFNLKSFYNRVLMEILWMEPIILLMIIGGIIKGVIHIFITGIVFQVIWINKTLRQEKFAISEMSHDDEQFFIIYNKLNDKIIEQYPLNDIELSLKPIARVGKFPFKLEILVRGELHLYQYLNELRNLPDVKNFYISFKKAKGEELKLNEKLLWKKIK